LAEGEAALSYFVDGGTGFGMITTRDTAAVVPLTEAGKLGKLAQLFRSSLRANDHGTYNGAANRLYTTTVQPLLAAVETEPSTLVVYPDGPLFSLPFEAFATEPGPADYRAYPFLIRQHAVRYGYGATLDAALHRDKSTSSFRLLGVAPQFKGHMEETLLGPVAPLPGTADELRMIEVEYGTRDHPTQTLLGQNATEEALKTLPLADFDIIHLATHGFVNPSNPGLSGLVLASAPAAATDEDNLLFAEETYALDLNARLVVLSACQTGLGSFVGGEGLLGLSRGFLYAGARQLAVSLWQVSDNGTRELMKSFHLAMLQGKPPGAALRSAKLKLLEHPQHSRPYYWAPFVLIGPGGTTG
jgi:CHAT domain-containing protein